MAKRNHWGHALTAIGLVGALAACSNPQSSANSASTLKVDPSKIGIATRAQAALDAAAEADAEAENDQPDALVIDDSPVLSVKPNRPVVVPVAFAPAPFAPATAVPVRVPRQRAAPGSKAKAAFTLRLDGERHLKLRLACAVTGRSAQQLVTEALDRLLGGMPELASMADHAPRHHAKR